MSLGDDDSGSAGFSVNSLLPGSFGEQCFKVTYTGTLRVRHHQGVTGPHRGQGLIQPGTGPAGSGQPVVAMDPVLGHTQLNQDDAR